MKRIMKVFTITFVCLSLCGCSYFKSKMNDIEKEKQVLKEQYGIEDDSQEQKDLELL